MYNMNKSTLILSILICCSAISLAQKKKIGDFLESSSYNEHLLGAERVLQYYPDGEDFVSINGAN